MGETKMKNFSKISEIKREIVYILRDCPDDKFPQYLTYQEEGNVGQYKITVELVDKDHLVDSKGRKWFRGTE